MTRLALPVTILALVAVVLHAVLLRAPAIEDEVEARVQNALGEEGIRDVGVTADGRSVTLTGAVADEETRERASRIASRVSAAREVAVDLAVLPPREDPISICQHQVRELLRREQVRFRSGSAELEPAGYPLLDRIVQVLRACDDASIQIGGHTDSQGDADANRRLSQARAESVLAYLRERGIDPSRMKAVGFGEAYPTASNDTEAGRRANRRIEFILWRAEP